MAERFVASAFLVLSGLYLALALRFPLGMPARPGPGFFPVGVGVFLCVVAAVFGFAVYRRPAAACAGPAAPAPDRAARLRVVATMAGLVGFCLSLPWAGYPAAAAVFLAFLLRRLGGGVAGALAGAVLGAGLSYYVFAVLLAVPLPRGVFLP